MREIIRLKKPIVNRAINIRFFILLFFLSVFERARAHTHTRIIHTESPPLQSRTFLPVTPKSVYILYINTYNDLVLFIILGMSIQINNKLFYFAKILNDKLVFFI